MDSEAETISAQPLNEYSGEQLALDYDEETEQLRNETLESLISDINKKLAKRHGVETFSFNELVEFAGYIGRSPQEAGKMFTRFYRGLEEAGIKITPPDYEFNRDRRKFPLALLSVVMGEKSEEQDDAYDTLLRVYYSRKMGSLVVKQSIST